MGMAPVFSLHRRSRVLVRNSCKHHGVNITCGQKTEAQTKQPFCSDATHSSLINSHAHYHLLRLVLP